MNQINSSQFYGNLTSFPFFYLNWKFSHLELCVFIGLSTIRWGRTPRNGSITAFEQKFMKSINFKIKSVTNGVETFPNNFGKYVPHLKLERLTAIFNRSDMLRNDRLPCDYTGHHNLPYEFFEPARCSQKSESLPWTMECVTNCDLWNICGVN